MVNALSTLVALEHAADLQREADRFRLRKPQAAPSPRVLALRLAEADDARALTVLAELDEEPELSGDALLALFDGEPVAAISLEDGRVVANPFVATGTAISLLKLRARHLAGHAVRRPWGRRWRFA